MFWKIAVPLGVLFTALVVSAFLQICAILSADDHSSTDFRFCMVMNIIALVIMFLTAALIVLCELLP